MSTDDTSAPQGAPLTPALLLAPLEFLARAAGSPLDCAAALSSVQRLEGFGADAQWFDLLVRVGEAQGLHMCRAQEPSNALRSLASERTPWLTRGEEGAELSGWVAVTGGKGGRLRVVSLEGGQTPRWVRAASLPAMLGRPQATRLEWLWAQDAEPLSVLRAEDFRATHDDAAAGGGGGGGASGSDRGGGGQGHGPSAHPTPVQRLFALMRMELRDLWVIVVYGIGVGVLSLIVPVAVQTLVNAAGFGFLLQPVVVMALLIVVCLGFAGLMRTLQTYAAELIQQRIFVHASADLAWRLPRVRQAAFVEAHGPELVNRFFDVMTLQKGAALLLVDGLGIALSTLTGMAILAVYHPVLLGFAGILITLMIVGVLYGLGRGGAVTAIKESKAKYEVAAWLQELARHPTTFKSGSGSIYAYARADALTRQYLSARRKHFSVVLRQNIGAITLQAVATAGLLGIGGLLVIERQLTLGQLIAAEVIVSAVVASFAKIGKYVEMYYDMLAALDKLGHLVELPLEREGGARTRDHGRPASLTLADVCIEGSPRAPLNLRLQPGEHLAILGAHGAGKTATCELLYGLRAPTAGYYEVDGVDTREIALHALRAKAAYAGASPELFGGTIAENVRVGRPEVGPEEIRRALERVALWDEIAAMPAGTQTPLTTAGAQLSGGQARRLALARAIAGEPRLLVVDELFDGLADETRARVLGALADPDAPWTLVFSTQRTEVAAFGRRTLELGRQS